LRLTSVDPRVAAFRPFRPVHWPVRFATPSTVSAFVNEAAPVPLGPPNDPVWLVPEMLNEPYVAASENGVAVPPLTLPEATVMTVVASSSPTSPEVFHLIVIVPVPSTDRAGTCRRCSDSRAYLSRSRSRR
jgi:hypothetical protein